MMVKVGMTIELKIKNDAAEYKAKVFDLTEDKFYISYPINTITNRVLYIPNGEECFIYYTNEENQEKYVFSTTVIHRTKRDIPLLGFKLPDEKEIIRVQRRKFVRIKTIVDVSLQLDSQSNPLPTITHDLSAGGCSIVVPQNFTVNQGDEGKILLVLPFQDGEYEYLNMGCTVIRQFEKNNQKLISLQFNDVKNQEQQQQRLMRFIFEKQIEYRKKGLLDTLKA